MPSDPWYVDIDYPYAETRCGKMNCQRRATVVGFASPKFRVITCDEHEEELTGLRKMAQEYGPIGGKPPLATVTWRRDTRAPTGSQQANGMGF